MKEQVSDIPIHQDTEVVLIDMPLNFCDPLVTDGRRGDYQSGSRNDRFLCTVIIPFKLSFCKMFLYLTTNYCLRFEVLTADSVKITVTWKLTSCSLTIQNKSLGTAVVDEHQCFKVASTFWLQESFVLKRETAHSSKMLVTTHQTICSHMPEDHNPDKLL